MIVPSVLFFLHTLHYVFFLVSAFLFARSIFPSIDCDTLSQFCLVTFVVAPVSVAYASTGRTIVLFILLLFSILIYLLLHIILLFNSAFVFFFASQVFNDLVHYQVEQKRAEGVFLSYS